MNRDSNHGALIAQIVDGLASLREHPGFLIVQIGDYYVQFRDADEPGILDFEAVSNEYLPEQSRLSENQIQRIFGLGFAFDDPAGNFHQDIPATEADCLAAAELSAQILYDIYLSPRDAVPTVNLERG